MKSSVLILFWLALAAGFAGAQDSGLQVRVVASNGVPLSSALVALIDERNVVFAEGLTSESGVRSFQVGSGTYRVRVRRIGYQPFFSEPVVLPRSRELVVRVDDKRVVLSAMVITASNKCGKFDRDGEALAAVWEEISKALRSSQLTTEDLSSLARARIYRKQVDRYGVVTKSESTFVSVKSQKPFSAIDPESLAKDGYVRGNQSKGWDYYGLDERVLLSESFGNTHCFRLTRDKERPGQVGMEFEPVPGRKKADVKGVLWLDENASELRDIEFSFTNAGLLTRFPAMGRSKFRRLPSGAWIVEEWKLSAPILAIRPGAREQLAVYGYTEDGGGVVVSSVPQNVVVRNGVLSGVVYDSIMMRPLVGATVTAAGATAITDSLGWFAFLGIPVTDQAVTFSHPSFSNLGIRALERVVQFESDTTHVALATPSMKTVWVRLCGDTLVKVRRSWEETALLHGAVRDVAGNPVPGATVKVFWTESNVTPGGAMEKLQPLKQETTADSEGNYAICGFLRSAHGNAHATIGKALTPRRDFDFSKGRVLKRDLVFTTTAPTAATVEDSASAAAVHDIIVTVLNSAGQPLSEAMVFLDSSAQGVRTDSAGVATVRTEGRVAVIAVRRLGFGEETLKITLGRSTTHRLTVTLSPVQTLKTVPVRADALLPADMQKRRTQGGIGAFYGPEEIAKVGALKNLVARTPHLKIEGQSAGRWAVRFPENGGCWADLYIDGVLSAPGIRSTEPSRGAGYAKFDEIESISPDAVAAMEIYPRVSEAPQNIVRMREGCGVILVWTKHYVESRRSPSRPAADSTKH